MTIPWCECHSDVTCLSVWYIDPMAGSIDESSCIHHTVSITMADTKTSSIDNPAISIGNIRIGRIDNKILDITPGQLGAEEEGEPMRMVEMVSSHSLDLQY